MGGIGEDPSKRDPIISRVRASFFSSNDGILVVFSLILIDNTCCIWFKVFLVSIFNPPGPSSHVIASQILLISNIPSVTRVEVSDAF